LRPHKDWGKRETMRRKRKELNLEEIIIRERKSLG
jgi:hypothetical protein